MRAYVDGIDFERDRVFGIQGDDLGLIGVAQLALDPVEKLAELGVSVDPACRIKGYGYALLQRSVLHAANLGYRVLFMYCLAENAIMMRLARKAALAGSASPRKASVRWTFSGRVSVPPVSLASVAAHCESAWAVFAGGHKAKKSRTTSTADASG